jgi:RNA polymerase sigma-70 factor (ECF subfamily)
MPQHPSETIRHPRAASFVWIPWSVRYTRKELWRTVTDEVSRNWSQLMEAAQSGDRRSYARLLGEIVPHIRRIAQAHQAMSGQPDQMEETVREVLLTLHRLRHTYDPARSFTGWLDAISHCRCRQATGRPQA